MKLLVIGQSVADIIDYNGKRTLQPGGIFYSITTLNNLKEKQDKISLVTAVDNNYYSLFKDEYEKPDEKIFNFVDNIPTVHLKIEQHEERHEAYENINQNLTFDVKDLHLFDGILINMITGFDITLEQLKMIRKSYNGLIYFDVHTMSRGLDDKMHRYFRTIPDFKEWAMNVDFIQVNKKELFTLSENKTEDDIINEVLNYGIKYLILTLEDKGAKIFFKENQSVKFIYEPSIEIEVKNKVGCGDVFGAVFFYGYISHKDKNIDKVLKTANIAAGCAASYGDINEFKNLKRDVSQRFN
jgi:sugar/nucleoside kinase (ribokinase family)